MASLAAISPRSTSPSPSVVAAGPLPRCNVEVERRSASISNASNPRLAAAVTSARAVVLLPSPGRVDVTSTLFARSS